MTTAIGFDIFARDRASGTFRNVGNSMSKAEQRSARLKTAMKAAGIAVAFAAVKIGKDSVKAASDLNEVMAKTEQIFGKQAMPALTKFADKAATSIGQSKTEALDAASTFGIFGKAAGLSGKDLVGFSTKFTKLASDMASFSNTSPEEAVTAIGAAMRGESEPIRRYGVLLSEDAKAAEAVRMGLVKNVKDHHKITAARLRAIVAQRKYTEAVKEHGKKSTEAMTAQAALKSAETALGDAVQGTVPKLTSQQKTLASASLIMQQTKDQQGDFARTSDGLANQQRILAAQFENVKVKIGTALLPIAVKLAGFASGTLMPIIEKILNLMGKHPKAFGAAAAAVGALWMAMKAHAVWVSFHTKGTFANAAAMKVGTLWTKAHTAASKLAAVATKAWGLASKGLGLAWSGIKIAAHTAAIVAHAVAQKAVALGTKAWAAAQWLLNVAMNANPIGLIITGVVALGAAIFLAWKKSETFRKIVTGAFNAVWGAMKAVWGWLKDNWHLLLTILTGPIGLAVGFIIKNWDKVVGAFKTAGRWFADTFGPVLKGVWKGITTVAKFQFNVIKTAITAVIKAAQWLWDKFKAVVGWIADKLKPAFRLMFDVFHAVAKGLVKACGWIADKFLWVVEKILGGVAQVDKWVGGIIPGDFDKAKDGVARMRDMVKSGTDKMVRNLDDLKRKVHGMPTNYDLEARFHDQKARHGTKSYLDYLQDRLGKVKDEEVRVSLTTKAQKVFHTVYGPTGEWGTHRRRAGGGPIFGPGTETSDDIPILASRNEHVWAAAEVKGAGGHENVRRLRRLALQRQLIPGYARGGAISDPLLIIPKFSGSGAKEAVDKIAAGASRIGDRMSKVFSKISNAVLEAMASGNLGAAIQFAMRQRGKPYVWGGVGPRGYDCSGFQSAITNVLLGRPPHNRLFATGSMRSALPRLGFRRGMGGRNDYSVGWYTGSPGHTAGTLGTIDVESSGGVGVRVGGGARGARNFPNRMHLSTFGFGPGKGKGVGRWTPLVRQVLRMVGYPLSLTDEVLHRIAQESGGDPYAVNNWDSNARAGHPSKGLMQTIPSTFAAYAGRYRRLGIFNPLANIYAGVRYAIDRYNGNLRYAMMKPGGYDKGGWLKPGVNLALNKTGEPEAVLTSKQWKKIDKLIKALAEHFGKDSPWVKASKEIRESLQRYSHKGNKLLDRLAKWTAKRNEFAASVREPFTSNDFFGTDEDSGWDLGDFYDTLREQTQGARAMLQGLRTARQKGLSGALFRLLAQSGNVDAARSFAGMSPMQIHDIEALYKTRQRAAERLGKYAGGQIFGDELRPLNRALNKLERTMNRLIHRLERIHGVTDKHMWLDLRHILRARARSGNEAAARRLARLAARRRKRRASGGPVWPNEEYLVGEYEPEIFEPSVPGYVRPIRYAHGGGGEPIVVKVYLDGRQVHESLLRHKRKRGAGLGLE